jgi:hypothetical protein
VSSVETLDDPNLPWGAPTPERPPAWTLAVAWSLEEPDRLGESATVLGAARLGRDDPSVRFRRWRPSDKDPGAPLRSQRLSRAQLELEPTRGGLKVRNVGKAVLLVNDEERHRR